MHENHGLNPFIEDVARRPAVEGFLAFWVELERFIARAPENEREFGSHPEFWLGSC